MSFRDVVETVSSGVICLVFLNDQNRVLGKGSGFYSSGHLITNNHVFALGQRSSRIWLRNCFDSETDTNYGTLLTAAEFNAALVAGSDEQNLDFAVLKVPALDQRSLYDFKLTPPNEHKIGDDIALLGFPLAHFNLACHKGSISSFYKSGPAEVIQVDASVNQSNSGGPLIDPQTGDVIGIITRKNTGLSNVTNALRNTVEGNIRLIQQASQNRTVLLSGVDPLQAITASQEQMLNLIGEIERSANVGIGYAFSIKHVLDEQMFQGE